MPENFSAVQIPHFGGPEVLKLVSLPRRPLRAGEVRIAVTAAGVNFADLMMRMGLYPEAPKPPFVPGYEVAGRVVELGSDIKSLQVGDRVMAGCRFGGYATEAIVPEHQARKIPEKMTDVEAAAVPVNFCTAWVALDDMARVRRGDRVLVQSAAGGVGLSAVQIAARAGARVTGLTGSPAKASVIREFGAEQVLSNDEWEKGSDQDLGGYDIILDPTGGSSLKRSLRRLAPAGRVVNYGASSLVGSRKRSIFKIIRFVLETPLITPIPLMNRNQGIFGLNMLQLFSGSDTPMGHALDRILEGFESGDFRAHVGKTFPFAEAGAAHTYLQSRSSIGKVVLQAPT